MKKGPGQTLLLLAIFGALVGGCLGSCSKRHVDSKLPEPTSSSPATTSSSPSAKRSPSSHAVTQKGLLGSRLTLVRSGKATVDVNMLEIVDPVSSSERPKPGNRLVAVRAELSNPAGPAYQERPYIGLTLVDSAGALYRPRASIAVDRQLPEFFELSAGAFKRGLVPFEIPAGMHIQSVRFAPVAGRSADIGEWRP